MEVKFNKKSSILLIIILLIVESILVVESFWPFDKSKKLARGVDNEIKCGDHIKLERPRVKNRTISGEAPFLVNIQIKSYDGELKTNCSGTLIDKDVIVTSIKCVENYMDSSIDYIVGSINGNYGQKIKSIRRIERINITREKGDCGHHDFIQHGVALIYFNDELKFNLKKNRDALYINKICKRTNQNFDNVSDIHEEYTFRALELFNWLNDDNCAKYIDLSITYCNDNLNAADHSVEPFDRLLCVQHRLNYFNQDEMQEGAPIVIDYNGRYNLVGILSKEADLYHRCELPHTGFARIIPLQLKSIIEQVGLPGQEA